MAIYLKLKTKPKTLTELFIALFSYGNSGILKSVTTYKDKECELIECFGDKYRSIDDLIEICETYFPSITHKEIFTTLFNTVIERGIIKYTVWITDCSSIRRPTMIFYTGYNPLDTVFNEIGGYGVINSKYSWPYAYRLAGFENINEVINHLKKLKEDK